MQENFDDLLKAGLYVPPADFKERVMTRLADLPEPEFPRPASRRTERLQWIALVGASLIGGVQLILFMFGIWSATSAG